MDNKYSQDSPLNNYFYRFGVVGIILKSTYILGELIRLYVLHKD